MDNSIYNNLINEYLGIIMIPYTSSERLFWLYILTSILIAVLIYFKKKNHLSGVLNFIFPKEIYQHQSSKIDLYIILLQPIFNIGFIFPTSVLSIFLFSTTFRSVLDSIFTSPNWTFSTSSYVIYSIIWIIVYDFAQYIGHYWLHKIPILWEFHKIHHSAEVLNPATAYRFHPFEIVITTFVITGLTSVVTALFAWLYNQEITLISVLNMHIVIFLFYVCGYHFRHSHIKVIYPRWLQHILVCPSQHQIHHSIQEKHWDKNIGYIFSVWDWLFGTLYIATHDEEYQYGLSKNQDETYRNLINVYVIPIKNAINLLKKN